MKRDESVWGRDFLFVLGLGGLTDCGGPIEENIGTEAKGVGNTAPN